MDRSLPVAFALALLLLPFASFAEASWDPAAEVANGGSVVLYLEYHGGTLGSREGRLVEDGRTQERQDRTQTDVQWESSLVLRPKHGDDGALQGQMQMTWEASASLSQRYASQGGTTSSESTRLCEGAMKGHLSPVVEARLEPEGLRVTLDEPNAVVQLHELEGCDTVSVWVDKLGTRRDEGTGPFGRRVALLHTLEDGDFAATASFLIPVQGKSVVPMRDSLAYPHGHESPALSYCDMPAPDSYSWAPGTCTASAELTVRSFVDPCSAIERSYREQVDALAARPPLDPDADEAGARAWAEQTRSMTADLLSAHRSWLIWACEGELEPDPWAGIADAAVQLRDHLEKLAREGRLSREGIVELIQTERQLQLLGIESDSALTPAQFQAAAPSGTMTVSVHSPVSLHVWSEDGGHVGWNATTDSSESTIPNATYEGAPGGPQRITLPAGFYKVVVDELEKGRYLLEVATEGTGVDTEDVHIVESAPGRTTTTHYALAEGWGGPRLDVFPVRRMATPAQVSFGETAPPPMRMEAGDIAPATTSGALDPAADERTPVPGVALVVLSLALVAGGTRLVRQRR